MRTTEGRMSKEKTRVSSERRKERKKESTREWRGKEGKDARMRGWEE